MSNLGKLEKFICYTVSVYPIYSGKVIGKPASKEVYQEEGGKITYSL